ncbi:MAG TPA: serine/threonine-protein kinase [Vicinamibacterales bacterium]|nr:serine/threonine-protein kinase [Vicinamibacterales bacterium]
MIGTTVGKYRIISKLGRGGMGTVYRAIDETLGREVAIKVLNSDMSDPKLMARFRAEATTLARLNHPDIATIFEINQNGDDLLMVMELVRGETLDQLSVRGGPLAPERAAYLVAQVLNGLGYAHRAGIVHRDLKPANVMLTDTGAVKIMDFGIARVLGGEHLTSDGTMMGTPAYMAPEQVIGKDIDARADLYSAGVVFYRLLTGCLPFQADTPIAMVQKQLWDAPTPVSYYRDDLPDWCQTVLTRALAKVAAERFQSADEFRSALLSAIGHSSRGMDPNSTAFKRASLTPAEPSVASTPSGGLTPAEVSAAAPTVTLVRTPTPAHTTPPSLTESGNWPTPVAPPPSPPVPLPAPTLEMPVPAAPPMELPSPPPAATLEMPALTAPSLPAAPPSPVAPPASAPVSPPKAAPTVPAAAAKKSGSAPASSNRTMVIGAVAAVLVIGAIGTTMMMRGGNREAATQTTVVPTPVVESTPPPETPAATAPAVADANAAAAEAPAATPTPAGGALVGTNGSTDAPKPPTRAARTTPPQPTAAAPPPLVVAAAPPPAPLPPAVPAAPSEAEVAAARMAALPPVIFSAQVVITENGRNRQRDTNVRLANGEIIVTSKDNAPVLTVPLTSIVGATYSNSKQPMWNTPQGPAEVVHLDSGAFGFLRGDQHWVSLRTEAMSLVLRVREQDSRRVVAALEERTGKKVEHVAQ